MLSLVCEMEIFKHKYESRKGMAWGGGDQLLGGQGKVTNGWVWAKYMVYVYGNRKVKLAFSINRAVTEKEACERLQTQETDTNREAANVLIMKYGVLSVGAEKRDLMN